MPKRRAQVADPDSDVESPPRRRRLGSEDADSSDAEASAPQTATQAGLQTMISKLVRLSLSAEYARIPIRRADISAKVLGESGSRQFKMVFEGAQRELSSKFGMQLIELPTRERDKAGLTQRRAATQASQKSQSSSSKSWTLISILPPPYKTSTAIVQPTRAPSLHFESTYTALYTFVISLVLLAPSASIPEAKLERYLKRANADSWTPIGQTDKILQKMVKEGYLARTRDTSSGEEIIEYVVGPRGKTEVGEDGVRGLVKKVYGGGELGEDELERRLGRSLGVTTRGGGDTTVPDGVKEDNEATSQVQTNGPRRRGRPRRNDDDDDD